MSNRNLISIVGEKVLGELINCYHAETPFYLKQHVGYLFSEPEDSLFISDEEIIDYVKKVLSDKYMLEITPCVRIFSSDSGGFEFEDIELKIILKEK